MAGASLRIRRLERGRRSRCRGFLSTGLASRITADDDAALTSLRCHHMGRAAGTDHGGQAAAAGAAGTDAGDDRG